MKLFSGTSNIPLATKIAEELKLKLGDCELSRFANGENRVWIKDDCHDETVFILQNFCDPVDSNILQFCLMVDAVRRMNPKKIVGVIPWLGYAKQNKVFRAGEPLAAEVVAHIVSGSGVDEVILLDVHSESVKSFFTVPVKELSAKELFVNHIGLVIANTESSRSVKQSSSKQIAASPTAPRNDGRQWVVVSPDAGAVSRNQYVADKLNLPLFVIDKERNLETGKITIKGIRDFSGNLLRITDYLPRGKAGVLRTNIFMFDDMILSGGTVVKDIEFLKTQGADDVYFFATHFCATEKTNANLRQTLVKKIIVTNSLEFDMSRDTNGKLEKIEVAKLFAEKIKK